ncbi:MAG: DegV family protein [Clostridiales bacterium]|nr:DegV family protein [Clostridiales bacterium]MDO4350798.1 DegV family protein [Eubacteriales bacterium]MDY4008878.1 DegV family protein [Candidatus Limiplasma sp.]
MAVALLIDSASDVDMREAESLGIALVPMTVLFDGESYQDGINLTHRQFFEKLIESDALPKTSQINAYQFEERFRELTSAGHEVVAITLSSKLSGTYFSAAQAAKQFGSRVYVVDSLNACIGERLLMQYALRLIHQALPAREIAAQLDAAKRRIRLIALLDTLEYLKKGGRISPTVALAGAMLHVKPVIAIEDGEVRLIGKAIGSKKGNNLLMQLVNASGGIDFSMPYATAYSGLEDSLLQKYLNDSAALWRQNTAYVPVYSIGSTIGAHVGPGAIAVAFFAPPQSGASAG